MKVYGYVNGQRIELDSNELIDFEIDRYDDDNLFHRWGGHTLARVRVTEKDKYVYAFLGGRMSGDMRAGSQHGVHLQLTVAKKNRDTRRECHALPVWPIKE